MIEIKHKKSWPRLLVIATAITAVTAVCVYVYGQGFQGIANTPQTKIATQPTGDLPSVVDVDKSREVKRAYTVPPTHPRHLRIPQLGVDANILSLGVTSTGALDAPATAWDVGWYNQSSLPGADSSALLLDGHVNNTIGTPGVFYELHTMQPGGVIELERGDGVKLVYSVVAVDQKPIEQVDMSKMLQSIKPGVQGLNIITCGGVYDSSRRTYDQRVLVYAVLNE